MSFEYASIISAVSQYLTHSLDIDFGAFRARLKSNTPDGIPSDFFPRARTNAGETGTKPDFIIASLSLKELPSDAQKTLLQLKNDSYRSKRLRSGYYITDHFGTPAVFRSQGHEFLVGADNIRKILWPYVVKALVTYASYIRGGLHLKGSVFEYDGIGTILIARDGGRKSVLVARFCAEGAHFVCNTHSIILPTMEAIGVPAAVRVRDTRFFPTLRKDAAISPAVKDGDLLLDPETHLGWHTKPTTMIRNIVLVNYRTEQNEEYRKSSKNKIIPYLNKFSRAINVYGLKEDIFASTGANTKIFSEIYNSESAIMHNIIDSCRLLYFNGDITSASTFDKFAKLLS